MSKAEMMTIEDGIELIKMKHGIVLDNTDPVLLLITILGDYFMRLQRLNEEHIEATITSMDEVVKKLSLSIEQETDDFKQSVRVLSLENVAVLITEHARQMQAHKNEVRNIALLLSVISFVVIAIFCFFIIQWRI